MLVALDSPFPFFLFHKNALCCRLNDLDVGAIDNVFTG